MIVISLYFGYKITNKKSKKRAWSLLFDYYFLAARNQQSFCVCSNPQTSQRIILACGLRSCRGKRTMDGYEPTENSQQKTLLIVDDNKDMLQFVSSCMKEDYQVYTATDGAAALELLQREQIDLIISDVMMPGIDGFELCRRVKSDINLSHIPVILLTARTTDVSRIEGLQLGADDYLTKPFNVEVLRLRVQKFIDWEQDNHRQFRQK